MGARKADGSRVSRIIVKRFVINDDQRASEPADVLMPPAVAAGE